MRRLSRSLLVLALLLCCPAAQARLRGDGSKAGPVMLNLKMGPSIPIYLRDYSGDALNIFPAAFALQLEAGLALDRDRRAYLVLPLELHIGGRTTYGLRETFVKFILPVGFQYDIPIPAVPGLYVYPRASLGYAAFYHSGSATILGQTFGSSGTRHGGVFAFELGVKYVIRHRFHVGFEPLSLPVHFYDGGNSLVVVMDYRMHLYGGVNF